MVEERLGDMLHWKKDDIAVSLGIHPKTEGEWTGEEAARIVAESDRLYRASIISVLVQPPALPTAAPGIIRRRPPPPARGAHPQNPLGSRLYRTSRPASGRSLSGSGSARCCRSWRSVTRSGPASRELQGKKFHLNFYA